MIFLIYNILFIYSYLHFYNPKFCNNYLYSYVSEIFNMNKNNSCFFFRQMVFTFDSRFTIKNIYLLLYVYIFLYKLLLSTKHYLKLSSKYVSKKYKKKKNNINIVFYIANYIISWIYITNSIFIGNLIEQRKNKYMYLSNRHLYSDAENSIFNTISIGVSIGNAFCLFSPYIKELSVVKTFFYLYGSKHYFKIHLNCVLKGLNGSLFFSRNLYPKNKYVFFNL